MSDPAQNYVGLEMQKRLRRQASKAWAIGLTVVILWLLAIVLPPVAKAAGSTALVSPIYSFFSLLCHQQADRSFHLLGEQLAVCSRCFGVYLGLVAGFAIYPLWRSIDEIQSLPRVWLFLSIIPITIDWSLTFFGIWENNHASRFITGLILGIACAVFIIPALVEITRNLTRRRGTFVDSPS
jgi:uncharacterized membrane protein